MATSKAAPVSKTTLAKIKARFANLPQTPVTDTDLVIDAAAAQELLLRNTRNRRLNRSSINRFTGYILRDEWVYNGDNIRVNKNGELDDGQNRLTALVEGAQTDPTATLTYSIVWGLEPKAQATMDTGSKRSLAHTLQLHGEANSIQLGATAKIVWQIEHGGSPTAWLTEPSYNEYVEFIEANPDLRDAVLVGMEVARTSSIPASCAAAAYFEASKVDASDAQDFFSDFADVSAQIDPDGPINGLRVLAQRRVKRGGLSRVEQASIYDACMRAFADYNAGNSAPGNGYRLTRRPRVWR